MSDLSDLARQGAGLLQRRRPQAARDVLRRAVAERPGCAESRLLLGRACLQAGQGGEAVAVLEALCADEASPAALEALATAYRRDARYLDVLALARRHSGPQMAYEAAMALTALGRAPEALAAFDALLAEAPDLAAAWFGSHAPALDLLGWPEAETRLRRAAACRGANRRYQALLAAYHHLLGRGDPADCPQSQRHLAEGARALRPYLAEGWRLFGISGSLLRWALEQAARPGLVLEFGVRRGTSIAHLAAVAGQEVHGFDSFEGLPEAWVNSPSGALTTDRRLPAVPANVALHAGWFEDTLPGFLAGQGAPLRFANIDSDLYSSARTVLTALAARIGPGSVLVFDEFIGNRSWRQDEYRAFHEHAAAQGLAWSIIAVGLATKQVAILIG
ncbi:macrocin-O-methyltransferase (TylF) [mine drainage metagenome]|uniref:Macrocin-O-methyltransferase (TylF) n=1 Tax=mine drainage metagenome TaxID=410659 RepID=A0A1J5R5D8_9ZZZZ